VIKTVEYVAPPPDEWEVDRSRLRVRGLIGSGKFSHVHLAEAIGDFAYQDGELTLVALKECADMTTSDDIKAFMDEAEKMKVLSQPSHPNVRL
jgi:hypothetical protein